jgi:acetyl esterase/lipase
MTELSAQMRKAHQLLANMAAFMPEPDGRPEYERHRDAYRLWSEQFPVPAGTAVSGAPGFPGLTVTTAASDANRVVLYFHGGGYQEGTPVIHREIASRLATAARAVVHLPDYPLAPEHRFPAPVEAATGAYRVLLDSGTRARRIAVGGDSAGGGLAIALMLRLRELGIGLPAAATPVSPWVDLTVTAPSYAERAARDPYVSRAGAAAYVRNYLDGADPTDPLASPVFGDLSGLPPLHIEVGTEEVLIDDSRTLYEHALRDGVEAELVITDGAPHFCQHFASFLPEARDLLERVGHHIWTHIPD